MVFSEWTLGMCPSLAPGRPLAKFRIQGHRTLRQPKLRDAVNLHLPQHELSFTVLPSTRFTNSLDAAGPFYVCSLPWTFSPASI